MGSSFGSSLCIGLAAERSEPVALPEVEYRSPPQHVVRSPTGSCGRLRPVPFEMHLSGAPSLFALAVFRLDTRGKGVLSL